MRCQLGELYLTSDAVVPSLTRKPMLSEIIDQIPRAELDEFNRIGYTVGGNDLPGQPRRSQDDD